MVTNLVKNEKHDHFYRLKVRDFVTSSNCDIIEIKKERKTEQCILEVLSFWLSKFLCENTNQHICTFLCTIDFFVLPGLSVKNSTRAVSGSRKMLARSSLLRIFFFPFFN